MSRPSKRIVPAVGSSSLSISRAVVDLPQPDSPTMPSVSPRRTLSVTSSTACTSPALRENTPEATGKRLVSPSTSISGSLHALTRRPPAATAARSAQRRRFASGSRWQASAWPPSLLEQRRTLCQQRSKRCGQRGWNAQPGGRWMTDGGEPSIACRCATLASTLGIDSSRPQV